MKIKAHRIYHGPSVYACIPVVHFKLGASRGTKISQELIDGFIALLPGLVTRHRLDSWLQNNATATPGSHARQLFECVCAELQVTAGCELPLLFQGQMETLPASEAVVAYEEADVCIAAATLACELISEAADSTGEPALANFQDRLDAFNARAQRVMFPVQDRTLIRKARAADIPAARLMGRVVVLGQGRFQQRLSATKTTHTNIVGNDIAANKDYSRRVLGECGLPIPKFARAHRRKAAVAAAEEIGYPVVIKPNNGQMGRGVSIGMKSPREVRAAYKRAREFDRSVLVEQMIPGADFRMMVINGKLYAASKRVPGHVVGDGVCNIQELVDTVNSDPRRGDGPKFSWTKIKIDDQANRLLTELGYDLKSVPAQDEVVFLRRNANTSDGGTAVDVTDEVHPDNAAIAVRAAKAIGLDIAGVDILTEDISKSMLTHGGAICEVNSRPGLRKHLWPAEGKPRDVLSPILDMLFPDGANGRVRTVVVTGSGNRKATARLVAQTLADQGCHVGLSTREGVEIDGRLIKPGRLEPYAAARMIFLDPDIDAAVFALDPAEILSHGLSLDAADVCVLIDEDATATDADNDPGNDSDNETGNESKGQSQAQTDAIVNIIAGITRDSVVLIASDQSKYAAIETVSLAPVHRLDSIGELHSKLRNFLPAATQPVKQNIDRLASRIARQHKSTTPAASERIKAG